MSLIFVYNAESDLFGQVTDFAHKILQPESYGCNLCKLTYGAFAMKREWKDFLVSLKAELEFFHKDEFMKKYPDAGIVCFPAVLSSSNGALSVVLTCEQINSASTLNDLQTMLTLALQSSL